MARAGAGAGVYKALAGCVGCVAVHSNFLHTWEEWSLFCNESSRCKPKPHSTAHVPRPEVKGPIPRSVHYAHSAQTDSKHLVQYNSHGPHDIWLSHSSANTCNYIEKELDVARYTTTSSSSCGTPNLKACTKCGPEAHKESCTSTSNACAIKLESHHVDTVAGPLFLWNRLFHCVVHNRR